MDITTTRRGNIVKSDIIGTLKNTATDFSELSNGNITNTYGFVDISNHLEFVENSLNEVQILKGYSFVKYIIDGRVGFARCELVNNTAEVISEVDGDYYLYILIDLAQIIAGSSNVDGNDVWDMKLESTLPLSGYFMPIYKINKTGNNVTILFDYRTKRDATFNIIDVDTINSNIINSNVINTDVLVLPQGDIQTQIDDLNQEVTEISTLSTLSNGEMVMGQNGSEGQSVFMESQNTYALAINNENIGDSTTNTRRSIRQFGSGVDGNTFKLALKKTGAPITLTIRVETDNAGLPSGVLIDANATAAITGASITTSYVDTTITLAGIINIPRYQAIHIVLCSGTYGSEIVDPANYFSMGYINTTRTRLLSNYTGSSWAGTTSKFDYFNGNTLDTSYRDNTGIGSININDKLYVQGAGGVGSGFIQSLLSLNYTNCSIGATLGGTSTGTFNYSDSNSYIRLYENTTSYVEINLHTQNNTGNKLITLRIVYGGVETYTYSEYFTSSYTYASWDFKIKKVGTDITFWVRNGSIRTQKGVSSTRTSSSYKTYIGLSFDHPSTEAPISYADVDNFRLSNTDFSTQYPTVGGTNFVYVSGGLFEDNVIALTNATNLWTARFDGILKQNCGYGSRAYFDFDGITNELSGLTPNSALYLSNTSGTLSIIPGTNIVKIGHGVSSGLLDLGIGRYPSVTSHPLNSATTTVGQSIPSLTYIPTKRQLIVFTIGLSAGNSSSASVQIQWSHDGISRTDIYVASIGASTSGIYEKSFIAHPFVKYRSVSNTGPYTSSANVTINVISEF